MHVADTCAYVGSVCVHVHVCVNTYAKCVYKQITSKCNSHVAYTSMLLVCLHIQLACARVASVYKFLASVYMFAFHVAGVHICVARIYSHMWVYKRVVSVCVIYKCVAAVLGV